MRLHKPHNVPIHTAQVVLNASAPHLVAIWHAPVYLLTSTCLCCQLVRTLDTVLLPHLADDVSIREPDDEPILGSVVLVLVLRHKTLPSKVVRPPLWRIQSHISMETIPSLSELSGAKGHYLHG